MTRASRSGRPGPGARQTQVHLTTADLGDHSLHTTALGPESAQKTSEGVTGPARKQREPALGEVHRGGMVSADPPHSCQEQKLPLNTTGSQASATFTVFSTNYPMT